MRYGFITPNFGHCGDVADLVEFAELAEASGWEGFFLWDHVQFPGHEPHCDPWIALGAIAMRTERLWLGPMVTPIPRRRPHKLARETTTIDRMSAGRLIMGVGSGSGATEFEAFGEASTPKDRAEQLDEGLEVLVGLWSGDPFTFKGKHYTADAAGFAPPVQRPRPPIWVAGSWPYKKPLRRAAKWDGIAPVHKDWQRLLTLDDMRDLVAYVRQHRSEAGKFDVAYFGRTRGDDPKEDAAIVREFGKVGVTWWVECVFPRHTADQIRTRIRKGPPRI